LGIQKYVAAIVVDGGQHSFKINTAPNPQFTVEHAVFVFLNLHGSLYTREIYYCIAYLNVPVQVPALL
jgi:hypothetical protein